MRSIFAAAVLCAAFALGGCADDPPASTATPTTPAGATAGSTPGATGSASPGPIIGGSDRAAICAGYQKAEADAEAKLLVILPKAADAIGDPAKAGPVLIELRQALSQFEAAMAIEGGRSADAELKATILADLVMLRQAIKDLEAAGTDVQQALAVLQTDKFKTLGEKVRSLCQK